MKIVTLYNHKGGVSKTTTTFNLAHMLAMKQKRVLMVDADPQCNLTELFMAPWISEADLFLANTGNDKSLPGTTLLQALQPRFYGSTAQVDAAAIEIVESLRYPG